MSSHSNELSPSPRPDPASPPPDPAPRPALRSNLDAEPNPFEQSFSLPARDSPDAPRDSEFPPPASRPARSSSPPAAHANGAPAVKTSPGTPKPVLPPLASLASPSDTTSFPWGFSSASLAGSLRSGPLSPAMLAGPQQQQQHHPHVNHHLAFDPSFVRTGLTPDAARSGLTPLIGGPVSFPPPSPNTTAYLAMVTNPSAASLAGPPATITPNTLSAISGVLGGGAIINANAPSVNGNHAPHPLSRSHRPTSSGSNPDASPPQHPVYTSSMQMPNANGTVEYSTSAAANGLFLLSQAHQELTKREEQQQRLQEAQRAHQTHEQPSRRAAAKRKSTSVSDDVGSSTGRAGVAASAGKRSRSSNNNNNRTRSRRRVEEDSQNDEDSEIDDEDQMMDDVQPTQSSSSRQNKKPETEEEKRKNFLERNRQAALKCRQRKKAWLSQLQAKVEYMTTENERLQATIVSLREEVTRLSAVVVAHRDCGLGGVVVNPAAAAAAAGSVGGGGGGKSVVSVPVTLPPPQGVFVGSHQHGHLQQQQQQQQHGNGGKRDEGVPTSAQVTAASLPVPMSVGGAGGGSGRGNRYGY